MDKKLFDKSSKFFKRDGFYVVLFVCLCIVATVAAVSAKNYKVKVTPEVVLDQQIKPTSDLALDTNTDIKTEVPNALQATTNPKASTVISVPKSGASTAVTKTVDYKFVKPVEGTLARPYTTDTVFCQTIGTYKTNNGIEIIAKLDSSVFAVLDGKVEKVENDMTELGKYIVISHSNGLKTTYANLNERVKVKVGDSVKKGALIGTIGKTRESYSEEKYGDHLHFEVMSGKDYVDPAKYVIYSQKVSQ